MRRNIVLTKELLYEEVIKKRKSFCKIATEFMVSQRTIRQKMKDFRLLRAKSCYICSKEWLIEQNFENNLSLNDMAELLGVTPTVIAIQFKKHRIRLNRVRSEPPISREFLYEELIKKRRSPEAIASELGLKTNSVRYLMKKSKLLKVEINHECSADWLIEQNHIKMIPINKIAKMIDCGKSTLQKQFNKHGIRPVESARIKAKICEDNLIGKKFNDLTVVGFSHKRHNHNFWLCDCICGKQTSVSTSSLTFNDIKSCGCRQRKSKLKQVGDITGQRWKKLIKTAKDRNIEFNITQEHAWELFEKQNGKCALSGIPLKICSGYLAEKRNGIKKGFAKASLDRIDSSLGYIVGNIQWVSVIQNKMKNKYSEEAYRKECVMVAFGTFAKIFKEVFSLCR